VRGKRRVREREPRRGAEGPAAAGYGSFPRCGGHAPEQCAGVSDLSVGELAEASGFPATTLRYYDGRGLINARRTAGNQRRYPRTVLRRLALIRAAQELGVPLAEIAAALPVDRDPSPQEWRALLAGWQAELDRRIAVLQELRDRAARLARCGCVRDCVSPACRT
jgi:MerR family redox-sensitive transcriptional activator SoxR